MYDGNSNNGNGDNGGSYLPFHDNNGKERMVLQVGPSGEPSIKMRDKNGVDRLVIGLIDGQPIIAFCNEKREPCFLLNQDMLSFGEDEKGLFEIRQSADVGLCVGITGKNDKGRITLGVSNESGSIVYLSDKEGRARVVMCIDEEGNPALNVMGLDGEVDWEPEIAVPTKQRRRKAV